MNPAIFSMLERYKCVTANDYQNALKEIIQEISLLGLWRAKFFEHAAFYGGTALRILYGLDRFSEDLDFSLLKPKPDFHLQTYLKAIAFELEGMGFNVQVEEKVKKVDTAIESAFIKAGTKEHLIKINVPASLAERVQGQALLSIKLEIDTDPPSGFKTTAEVLLQPIPFTVNTYSKPDLFAGKVHALLQRQWKTRVKGRDYYDFVWYVARNTPVHLSHLEQRLRQSGAWLGKEVMTPQDLQRLLREKFLSFDVKAAQNDVRPFLRDAAAVELWSPDFFVSLLPRLKTI